MRHAFKDACVLAVVLAAAAAAAAGAEDAFPPSPGPFVGATSDHDGIGFRNGEPIVGTYYFYWYDDATGEHFIDPDGTDALTRHPTSSEGYSYRSAAWHERELRDMLAAGLDFALPVYWGTPGDHGEWSFAGLPPLVEGARALERAGVRPPRLGCFYDTSTLRYNRARHHVDLRTDRGREWFYVTVRDFYSLVPPDLRAAIDGRPIVWLYSAAFAKAQDPAALDDFRKRFEADFGVAPYIVKEVSWQGRADATYSWGAALGPKILDIAAIGPGYDHSAVPGRAPLVREREDGAFYRRSWTAVLALPVASRPWICMVETWNEWHEGTDIAPSRESGRMYIDITREYAERWHARGTAAALASADPRTEISITLGESDSSSGLARRDQPDGVTRALVRAGRSARTTVPTEHGGRYIYFDVDDAFYFASSVPLEIEVTYFDAGGAAIGLDYDSSDRSALLGGAFKPAKDVEREGTGAWRTARFDIADASFLGRANGHDFRLVDRDGTLIVHRVVVRKPREKKTTGGGATTSPTK